MMKISPENGIAKKLLDIISEDKIESLEMDSQELLKAILALGSATDDNVNCINHVEYGMISGLPFESSESYGLKLKGKNLLLSDVMNVVENLEEVPGEVKESFPDLTNDEWGAVTRMVTIVLVALERHKLKGDGLSEGLPVSTDPVE